MNFVRWIPLALSSIILGCSGAEPEAGQAAERGTSAGYGYEFLPLQLGPHSAGAAPAATAAVSGRLAPETIRDVVRAGSGALSGCYQAALGASPGLAGELSVRFTIGEDGSVSGARVEKGSVSSGSLPGCVAAAFGAMRFPASSGGTATVVYPIHFAP